MLGWPLPDYVQPLEPFWDPNAVDPGRTLVTRILAEAASAEYRDRMEVMAKILWESLQPIATPDKRLAMPPMPRGDGGRGGRGSRPRFIQ